MSTSVTIDMPEVALFDPQELKLKLSSYVKRLALKMHGTKEETPTATKHRTIKISPEVMAMTFQDRVDFGTNDYKSLLEEALQEKYK